MPPVASRDELPLDSPGVLGTLGCLVSRSDLGVDLLLVVAVVVNREGDPADIERKDLGGGGDGNRTALVNLAQDLDDLPYVRAVSECRPTPGRPVLEQDAGVVRPRVAAVGSSAETLAAPRRRHQRGR